MYTLAHFSDPHLPLSNVAWRSLANKRLSGYLSWLWKRRHVHDRRVLDALVDDLARTPHDHVAITGDLTNLALPAEFDAALDWLDLIGPADKVSVIPGNHDAYVDVAWVSSFGRLGAFMAEADAALKPKADLFPYVRHRGPFALIGVSTAVVKPLFQASGEIGAVQLDRLADRLEALRGEDRCRVVLIHHSPVDGAINARKHLCDAAAFRRVINMFGAELILHGHHHRSEEGSLEGPDGPVPVLGAPSASALPVHGCEGAAYHLFRLCGTKEAQGREPLKMEVEIRRFDPTSGSFRTAHRKELLLPRPSSTAQGSADGALQPAGPLSPPALP